MKKYFVKFVEILSKYMKLGEIINYKEPLKKQSLSMKINCCTNKTNH